MRETPFVRYEKLHRFTRLYVETIRVKTHLVIHANGNCAIDRHSKQTRFGRILQLVIVMGIRLVLMPSSAMYFAARGRSVMMGMVAHPGRVRLKPSPCANTGKRDETANHQRICAVFRAPTQIEFISERSNRDKKTKRYNPGATLRRIRKVLQAACEKPQSD